MSYLLNEPASFVDEMIGGFALANSQFIRRVAGGVVRSAPTPRGQVAVVIGGGSGHYPAFGGLVGQGLAHGAAMGNVFASPSAQQVYSVARAAASDAGVLLSYGNYAGDVLNFDQAQERLIAAGIPCRTVTVTDDICSAGEHERQRRRGIAGALAVFRAAAFAAEQGRPLDEVWAFAAAANARVRTIGVAFSGCTLPGAERPLFTVPPGRMAVGMGIHGEPGIEEQALPTARELGYLLVDRLLASQPADVGRHNGRVGVILNGLGAVKYEELFVTYASVAERLGQAGLTIVQPEIGEMVTSFEMAGASLSLIWLDDELEQAWTSPAATPAYRRGTIAPVASSGERMDETSVPVAAERAAASEASRACAPRIVAAVAAIKSVIDRHADNLGQLDAVAGDGDHGIGMQRGATAALAGAEAAAGAGAGAGGTLMAAGEAWADHGGGTSGALWGVGLRAVASVIGDERAVEGTAIARGVADAAAAILRVGKAQAGDKTMLDALLPFSRKLSELVESGAPLADAWRTAADLATQSAAATANMLPRVGRARPHAEKSVGTPDPGAVSLALAVTAVAAVLAASREPAA